MTETGSTRIDVTTTDTNKRLGFFSLRDEIDRISSYTSLHTNLLTDALADFFRETKGQEIVYALDFDVIYALLFPWKCIVQEAVVAKYILEHMPNKFFLPVGCIRELIKYLDNTVAKIEDRFRENKTIHPGSKLTLKEFATTCLRTHFTFSGNEAMTKREISTLTDIVHNGDLSKETVHALANEHYTISTIQTLLGKPNYLNIKDVFNAEVLEQDAFKTTVGKIESRLASESPIRIDKDINNRNDAYNMAIVLFLNDPANRRFLKDKFTNAHVRLITNSSTLTTLDLTNLCRQDTIIEELLSSGIVSQHLNHTSPIKTCWEAVYTIGIKQKLNSSTATDRYEWTKDHLRKCLAVKQLNLESDTVLRQCRVSAIDDLWKINDSEKEYENITLKWLKQLEEIRLEDLFKQYHQIFNADTNADVTKKAVSEKYPMPRINRVQASILFYDVPSKLAELRYVFDGREAAREKQQTYTAHFLIHDIYRDNVQRGPTSVFEKIRWTRKQSGRLIFGAENHGTFYSVYWHTLKHLGFFINVIRDFLCDQQFSAHINKARIRLVFAREKDDEVDEQALLVPTDAPFPFSHLCANTFAVLEKQARLPQHVRFETSIADFLFDVLPEEDYGHKYVGILSNKDISAHLHHFIDNTIIPILYPSEINSELSETVTNWCQNFKEVTT